MPDKVKEGDIIKVFYETDQYKHNENGEDSETGGDGIPDKAQVLIRYKVENGKWDNGSSNEIIQVITLYNEEENYSEDGTGSSLPPSVGNSPNEGYKKGSWNKEIPTKVSKANDESEYIYSYEQVTDTKADSSDSEKPSNIDKNDGKKEKEIKNVEEKEKTSNNPKTSDTVQHYIAYGFAGMIFMMMVIRIRKKYGRKIRKIQY